MFWENYIRLCNSIDKSPNAVAAACGVKSSGTVTGWSNGAKPRQAILLAIADYFNVPVSELTGEGQREKPAPEGESIVDEIMSRLPHLTPDQLLRVIQASTELALQNKSRPEKGGK